MKTTADTSVIVASFASWHENHAVAVAAIARIDVVIAHCLLETYSVLTRFPAPHRMAADVVAKYLHSAFGHHPIVALPANDHRKLVAACAAQGLSGGTIYDAAIAATTIHAGAKLLTLDGRARPTYVALGADHELLS